MDLTNEDKATLAKYYELKPQAELLIQSIKNEILESPTVTGDLLDLQNGISLIFKKKAGGFKKLLNQAKLKAEIPNIEDFYNQTEVRPSVSLDIVETSRN